MWKIDRAKLTVEIWSDLVCPWCYIGKRRFEKALESFEFRDQVEIVWKSYLLDPQAVTVPGRSINQYLADRKGWDIEEARRENERVTQMALDAGLIYDFDKAIPTNTLNAHRLEHLARKHGLGNIVQEMLFKAHFTDGKNIDDNDTLTEIGTQAGLNRDDIVKMLGSDEFVDEVNTDIYEAGQVGARGVPYYVFNNQIPLSGSHQPETYLNVLKTAWILMNRELAVKNENQS